MKKLIVSILAFLYITSTCGATVYLHYCMGKQVSFSFMPEHSVSCHKCGMKKTGDKKGCCKDEKKVIKSGTNQGLSALNFSTGIQKKITFIGSDYYSFSKPVLLSKINISSEDHGPPGNNPVPFYLMNCLLLI
jgi:hypothetical protein